MSVPDLTFHQALRRRLSRLTPAERVLILAEALHLLRTVLPRLEPAAQRTLALQVAAALDAAGCHGEAAVLRLCVSRGTPLATPLSWTGVRPAQAGGGGLG